MLSWASGLEPLTKLLAQFSEDGKLSAIGSQTHGSTLTTSWYFGDEKIDDVVILPSTLNDKSKLYDWPGMRWARPGRQSAWAWRWALEEIVKEISNLLNNRKLPLPFEPLTQETIWKTALTITEHGSLYNKPIFLTEIEQQLSSLSEYSEKIRKCGEYLISLLRSELSRLHQAGKCAISSPWPGPDLEMHGGLPWAYYSDDQILSRTKAVFAGALSGYQQLVDTWFPKCASMLATAVVLPARLIGVLTPPNREKAVAIPPVLDWYLEALPKDSQNIVEISFAVDKVRDEDEEPLGRKLYQRLCSRRPDAAEWISHTMHVQNLRIFGPNPATSLALSWLWDDLRKVSLVNGVFKDS